MREAAVGACGIVVRDVRLALRRPAALLARSTGPFTALAGCYFVARLVDPHRSLAVDGDRAGYFAYVSVNVSFLVLLATALQSFSATVRNDQLIGTLEPIFATRTSPGLYVLACGVWPLFVATLQVGVALALAAGLLGLDLHAVNVPSLVAFVALGTLTMGALGILSAAGVVAFKGVPPTHYLVGGAASLLAGTLFPTHLLPWPVRIVSWCLPLTHALRGIRAAVAGDSFLTVMPDVAWLGVAVVVLLPLSFAVLGAAIERGRRDGTLAHY